MFFQGPPDIINFLESLQKSIKEGNFDDLTIEADTRPDEAIIKESRTEAASDRVQALYDTRGTEAAFDIIQEFKPITSRLVERRSQAPGFDRQLLTDEIETGARGILDLIQEYKPESGVPLAAYINRFLPSRTIEASRRVLGEEFTTDVAEAREVVAEEVAVVETPVKPEKRRIDPFRIMDIKREATEEVRKNIADKDVDVTTVTYKELKDIAPYKAVADFFNIPVSRISNPKDNLRKGDNISDIQRWILKNEPTLKNLFTEANREVVEVEGPGGRVIRKGGEPTGIPRNLLKTFYTKGKRVGNNFQWTLKPYDRNTFLEAVGIKEGKVDPDFVPRSAEAQTMKGLLEMYARNLGNVVAREVVDADIDIKPEVKARAKVEIAKGKPRLMFSKTGVKAEIEEIVGGRIPNTAEGNQQFRDFLTNNLVNVLGRDANKILKPGDLAGAGNSAVGRTPRSGALGRDFRFIGSILRTKKFIDETKKALETNKVMDLNVMRKEIDQAPQVLSDKQVKDIIAATSSQTRASMKKNELNKESIKRGRKLILKFLFEAAQGDPKNLLAIGELLYNQNANTSFGRKFATVTSIETNLKPNQKTWEEHVYQFGNWAIRTLQAFKTGDINILNNWLKWADENYYQEVTSKETQDIVDGRYKGWNAKSEEHPFLKQALDKAFKTGDFSNVPPSDIRKYNEFLTLNPNIRTRDGITDAERYNVSVLKNLQNNLEVIKKQGELIYQQFIGDITAKQARARIKEFSKIAPTISKASISNNKLQPVGLKYSKAVDNNIQINDLSTLDEAFDIARNADATTTGINVWDFDITLASNK